MPSRRSQRQPPPPTIIERRDEIPRGLFQSHVGGKSWAWLGGGRSKLLDGVKTATDPEAGEFRGSQEEASNIGGTRFPIINRDETVLLPSTSSRSLFSTESFPSVGVNGLRITGGCRVHGPRNCLGKFVLDSQSQLSHCRSWADYFAHDSCRRSPPAQEETNLHGNWNILNLNEEGYQYIECSSQLSSFHEKEKLKEYKGKKMIFY